MVIQLADLITLGESIAALIAKLQSENRTETTAQEAADLVAAHSELLNATARVDSIAAGK